MDDIVDLETIFEETTYLKNLPMGHREVKREEFLEAYEKKFGVGYGTLRHEGRTF